MKIGAQVTFTIPHCLAYWSNCNAPLVIQVLDIGYWKLETESNNLFQHTQPSIYNWRLDKLSKSVMELSQQACNKFSSSHVLLRYMFPQKYKKKTSRYMIEAEMITKSIQWKILLVYFCSQKNGKQHLIKKPCKRIVLEQC